MTSELLDAQGLMSEINNLFKECQPQRVACPSGLRCSHLQAVLCDQLVEDLAASTTSGSIQSGMLQLETTEPGLARLSRPMQSGTFQSETMEPGLVSLSRSTQSEM